MLLEGCSFTWDSGPHGSAPGSSLAELAAAIFLLGGRPPGRRPLCGCSAAIFERGGVPTSFRELNGSSSCVPVLLRGDLAVGPRCRPGRSAVRHGAAGARNLPLASQVLGS